ncbi:MAG: NAD-dependent epimerase, partial [Rhodospirillaceae bacterium]|nr:NAD-dependent epimerase [Rhodospirillaceae bacterium]
WPPEFETTRANAMGFIGDTDMRDVIRGFIEDELGGEFQA